MEDEIINSRETNEIKPSADTLLVLNIHTNEVEMVKGIDKEGNLQKFLPEDKKENDQLIKVDKHSDLFFKFFSNFYRQLKNPSHFNFFKVSEYDVVNTAKNLQKYVNQASPEEKEKLKDYEVLPKNNNNHKNQNMMDNKTENQEFRFQPEQIDWKMMEKFGLNQEKLEKMNAMDSLLKGYKTNTLIPITINLGTAVSKMDVRLSLQIGDTGQVAVHLHGIRKEPNLNNKFFGHQFSDDDKKNLKETGNMGRVVDLINPRTDEIIPSVISRDRLTNELVAYRVEYMKVPNEIKGIKLNEHQKQTLLEGRPLYLEGMISKKGESFDATVQFNADKRYVEFLFNNKQAPQKSQHTDKEAPRVFRGKELDDSQYEKLKDGQTIYVDGLEDAKGKAYQGYITFNKETSKTDFSFTNPNKLKEKTKFLEDYKTQTAVISQGKTSETAKNIKETLKTKQQQPVSKEKEDQQKKLSKSRGRKL